MYIVRIIVSNLWLGEAGLLLPLFACGRTSNHLLVFLVWLARPAVQYVQNGPSSA